ncbi:MAG: ABC exporter membrane fusion protein [Cyanobacteria bacterium J06627_8]
MSTSMLSFLGLSSQMSRRWMGFLGVGILSITGVAIWSAWQLRDAQRMSAESDASLSVEINTVTALGRLEPNGELVNLTAPTSIQESRIDQLLIQEGDRIEVGQVIAILDNRDRLEAALLQAEEQVSIARANLAQVNAGAKTGELQAQQAEITRLEADQVGTINTQQATIARLDAEVRNARIEAERYESLYDEGAISASERDTKRLTFETSQRQLQEAEAALERIQSTTQEQILQARATLDQLAEVRPVDVAVAEAEVQSAIAAVAEAKADLDQAYVRSPRAGQIIKIHTRPGENIADEGIATLGQTQEMMAIAEIYQSDVAQIEIGQPAEITSSAIPGTLTGTVERIGLQVEQQEVVDEDPATNIDARVVEVHIRLDPDANTQVAGLSNLQVMTTIRVD